MNSEDSISNEQINAYVDDQLSTEVKAEILKKSQHNEDIADSICQTRVVKEMVQLSYQNIPKKPSQKSHSSRMQYGIAASLFILVGCIAGWNGAYFFGNSFFNHSFNQVQLNTDAASKHHVLLHISTDEKSRVDAALNNAERLLSAYNSEEKFQLQIVVNAEGIKILQEDNSPYLERIRSLASQHENVSLLACQRSIERQQLKGVDVHLVKEASVIPEALEEIVHRLHQGWVYIRA